MTNPASLAEAREFVRNHAVVLGLVALAMLIGYGFALTSFALSADEDTAFLVDWSRVWIDQGRLGIPLMQFVLRDAVALPFFNMALALVFLFTAGVIWAFIFSHAARPRSVGNAAVLVFLIVFTTLPINAYYLAFDTLNAEVSLAWAFAAASIWWSWRWTMEGGGWAYFVGSAGAAALAMVTYQDFAFTAIAGVVIIQLAYLLGQRQGDAPDTRRAIRQTVSLALPMGVALGLTALAAMVFVERGGYIESSIAWGSNEPAAIIRNITGRVSAYLRGDGFQGGWVLLPTIAAGLLLIVLVAVKSWRERRWYPTALLLLLSLLPIAGWIAIGHPLPNRSMQAVVLVAASLWLLLALLLRSGRQVGTLLLIVAFLFAVWNGGILTRSYVTEHQTYEADRDVAREIGERLVQQGWDGTELPIVTIGWRTQGVIEGLARQEFVGFSLYNAIDGRRSPGFMKLMGYPMRQATDTQATAAREYAMNMPDWPAAGAVVLENGVAIVKFSAPCANPRDLRPGQCALGVAPPTEE